MKPNPQDNRFLMPILQGILPSALFYPKVELNDSEISLLMEKSLIKVDCRSLHPNNCLIEMIDKYETITKRTWKIRSRRSNRCC